MENTNIPDKNNTLDRLAKAITLIKAEIALYEKIIKGLQNDELIQKQTTVKNEKFV